MLRQMNFLIPNTHIRSTVQIAAGGQRWFRRRLIDLMGNYRINQIGRGQRALRRWSHSHPWLHGPVTKWQTDKCYKATNSGCITLVNSPFHPFIDHFVVLPATFLFFLVSQPFPVPFALLPVALLPVTLLTVSLFPLLSFPLLTLSFPFALFTLSLTLTFQLPFSFPLDHDRALAFGVDVSFPFKTFSIVHDFSIPLHLLFPVGRHRRVLQRGMQLRLLSTL